MLIAPDGTAIPDVRTPYFSLPPWEEDPFADPCGQEANDPANTLKDGRYIIESALAFSNSGGVYLATDAATNRRVLVKEARPYVEYGPEGSDAISMLHKEYRILSKLQGTNLAPEAIDIFEDWEHWFLVEEFIDGTLLGDHSAVHNIALRTRPTPEMFDEFYELYRRLFANVARLVDGLCARRIVFGDLSPNNLIVPTGTVNPRLIDFEGAYEYGVDSPSLMFTPGYASTDRVKVGIAGFEEDYYSLGALMFAYLFPLNSLFVLKPDLKLELLRRLAAYAGLPTGIGKVILRLLSDTPAERPTAREVVDLLEQPQRSDHHYQIPLQCEANDVDQGQFSLAIEGIVSYILNSATYGRTDRLFPANERVFTTNPLSIAYGACGICWSLQKLGITVPTPALDWILQHQVTTDRYPPGLYIGLSGIAWALLDLGLPEVAQRLMSLASQHPLLEDSPDLFWGLAGWGIANIHFFYRFQDEAYLDRARKAADRLLLIANEENAHLILDEHGRRALWDRPWSFRHRTVFPLFALSDA